MREIARTIDDLAPHDGEVGGRVGDLLLGTGEIISVGNDQIGELSGFDTAFPALLV